MKLSGALVATFQPIFVAVLLLAYSSCHAFLSQSRTDSRPSSHSKLHGTMSTVLPPAADLTPAIDKFVKFPSSDIQTANYLLTSKSPPPSKIDAFALVADDLQPLSDYVKELVVSENPVLTMAASHFFQQVRHISSNDIEYLHRSTSTNLSDTLCCSGKVNDSGPQ